MIRYKTATNDCFKSMGISLYVPKDRLNAELSIYPCFTGPFELPDEYESASPAYLILHNKQLFQEDITVRIHHYANLQSEEDCADMVFLSASSAPDYQDSHPVYTFKELVGSQGMFKPGDQVGEVLLRHFCFTRVGKRKRKRKVPSVPSSKKHQGELAEIYEFSLPEVEGDVSFAGSNWYSARLYRSEDVLSAMFCMCLFDSIYIEVNYYNLSCDHCSIAGHVYSAAL